MSHVPWHFPRLLWPQQFQFLLGKWHVLFVQVLLVLEVSCQTWSYQKNFKKQLISRAPKNKLCEIVDDFNIG